MSDNAAATELYNHLSGHPIVFVQVVDASKAPFGQRLYGKTLLQRLFNGGRFVDHHRTWHSDNIFLDQVSSNLFKICAHSLVIYSRYGQVLFLTHPQNTFNVHTLKSHYCLGFTFLCCLTMGQYSLSKELISSA
jgi:hypothetical protein